GLPEPTCRIRPPARGACALPRRSDAVDPVIEEWFARRTWQEPSWTVEELVAAKRGRRVSVVLPALDEEATVGAIVAAIVPLTRGPAPLVDELVVVGSGSEGARG